MATKTNGILWKKLAVLALLGSCTRRNQSNQSEIAVLGFSPSTQYYTTTHFNSICTRTRYNKSKCIQTSNANVNVNTIVRSKASDDVDDSNSNNINNSNSKKGKKKSTKSNDNELTKMTPLDRAMKKARARAEIDRLTKGPDAVYDREGEMNKIGGISPGLEHDSADSISDFEYYNLESKLSQAVEQGDFKLASQTREVMDRMHIDDCGYVLQLNSAFYKAFSEKDFDEMKALWMDDNTVQCIHPSHPPVTGYVPIMESWKQMFQDSSSDNSGFRMNTIEPTNIRLSVKGATAWLTCDEEVYAPKFIRGVGKKNELIKKMMATNIFRKVHGKWSMVHHHATWHPEFDQGKNNKRNTSTSLNGRPAIQSTTISLGGLGGQILGNPSPSDTNSGDTSGSNGTVKRVFMGSLSDLLNGGLSDLLSDDDIGNNNDNKDGSGKTIIRVNSEFDDEDDDDDEDDEDNDDDDDETISSYTLGANLDLSDTSANSQSKQQSGVPKDALRQNCITALRKLANQGTISPKQKRLLLTDIITCSAKGEFSMVEVAYELLCGEGDDKDAAEEEFADQCRVFAEAQLSNDYPPNRL